MRSALELLAPAGTAQIGKAAIDHGADAVYIGAPQFGARAQAGSTIADIAELTGYAHLYHARVYVALNTILTDAEIPQALEIIHAVHGAGADGLIIQDVGLLELALPPIALIASTQMHNATPEKVKFLEAVGFQRVILARELSLEEIAAIRARTTTVALEAFVHGALCVSYSGQCYMSQFTLQRSGNRGVCAQPCRHSYTLTDGDGRTVVKDRHLLSLKDMNRLDSIAALAAAGVTSFKIEGRYKDIDYVKNITAAYSLALDRFIAENPRYRRSASGTCTFPFEPNPEKTFNRGYTAYFLTGERQKAAAMDTPKSMGEFIGRIEAVGRDFFSIRRPDLHNGDGLCFFSRRKTLAGCRVERVEGGKVYPNTMKDLFAGTALFRNFDIAFSRALKKSARCRTLSVEMMFHQTEAHISLSVADEDGVRAIHREAIRFEPARDPLRARSNIQTQLTRTGDTPYRVTSVSISPDAPGFLALSFLNDLRRKALENLTRERCARHPRDERSIIPNAVPYPETEVDYRANILNTHAEAFYLRHGAKIKAYAPESMTVAPGEQCVPRPVMTTRYCLRFELDACLRASSKGSRKFLKPPLRISDRRQTYRLAFDCRACCMQVFPESEPRSNRT
jgi:putative protease